MKISFSLQYLVTDESWSVFIDELNQACGSVLTVPVREAVANRRTCSHLHSDTHTHTIIKFLEKSILAVCANPSSDFNT